MIDLDRIAADLRALRRLWPDLCAAKSRSAVRRSVGVLSAEVRAELDELARRERAERTVDAPGWSPTPADVSVLDAVDSIVDTLLLLETRVRIAAKQTPLVRRKPVGFDDRPVWVTKALEGALCGLDEELLTDIQVAVRWCLQRARQALGMTGSTFRLPQPCPFCSGSLIARTESALGPIVFCGGESCDPAVWTSRWNGGPVWTVADWEALAMLLRAGQPAA